MASYGRPFEIGLSGAIGEVQAVAASLIGGPGVIFPAIDEVEQTRAVALDFQLKCERMGFRAEAFWGRAAGTYFVGVLQTLNPETAPSGGVHGRMGRDLLSMQSLRHHARGLRRRRSKERRSRLH